MSTIGRLVIGRDLGEAILIGDDIAVVFTKDKAGTNNQGIRLMIIAPKGVLIGRTPGPVDPQALVLAAERKQMQACRLVGGKLVDKPSPVGAEVRTKPTTLDSFQRARATTRT